MFKEEGKGQTHWVCANKLRDEGGKAKCCECNPHENCGDDNILKGFLSKEKIKLAAKDSAIIMEIEMILFEYHENMQTWSGNGKGTLETAEEIFELVKKHLNK